MSHKLNLFELESLRSELIEKSVNTSSNFLHLSLYQKYFDIILSLNNPNLEEAFLKEFLDDYINCISKFEVWGTDPEITKRIINHLQSVITLKIASENLELLKLEFDRIGNQLEKLNLILKGKEFEDGEATKAFFPLIDNDAPEGFYGIIDSVTVRISKGADKDKFIIVPSEKEIEKKILEQCKNSWILALKLSKKYVKKPYKFHEVIISFDKKEGFYEGNSLGIALTISFLEEILKFYNPTYLIKLIEKSAFTGGVAESGEILNTSENIIKRKVSLIFFSQINSFVIPKLEETYAYFTLAQLKKNYPNRKLKLIPAEDITDVLNRRDLVDIRKQKVVVRSAKFVKKNWISAVATVLLAILFTYLFVIDFDDNPESLYSDGNKLFVKNKNGKVLWTLNVNLNIDVLTYPELLKNYAMIIDLNGDNENELLFIQTALDERNVKQGRGTIIYFDKYQKIKWEYTFQDTVFSERENLQPVYDAYLIDTTTIENRKVLLSYANNSTSFSSAIFALDLNTGERINNTQWNSGYTWDAMIIDPKGDGERELVAMGADNGLKDAVLWGMKVKNINGYRPTTPDYRIRNFDETKLQFYLRIPNTDYDSLTGTRSMGMLTGTLIYDKINYNIRFTTISKVNRATDETVPSFHFSFNIKAMDFEIFLVDKFTSKRDSLVAIGKLNPPYTDTKEYKAMIKNNILYWQNSKWLKRKEI